jgi:hypothetical protein
MAIGIPWVMLAEQWKEATIKLLNEDIANADGIIALFMRRW